MIKASFVALALQPPGDNYFTGTVIKRTDGQANTEIILEIGHGKTVTAVVVRAEADRLNLSVGTQAYALFSADHIILAAG